MFPPIQVLGRLVCAGLFFCSTIPTVAIARSEAPQLFCNVQVLLQKSKGFFTVLAQPDSPPMATCCTIYSSWCNIYGGKGPNYSQIEFILPELINTPTDEGALVA
jgi:hypothetical protein